MKEIRILNTIIKAEQMEGLIGVFDPEKIPVIVAPYMTVAVGSQVKGPRRDIFFFDIDLFYNSFLREINIRISEPNIVAVDPDPALFIFCKTADDRETPVRVLFV